MAPSSFLRWLIPIIVVSLLIANRHKIDRFMSDLADGIRMFKERMNDPTGTRVITNMLSAIVLIALFLMIIAWGLASNGASP